MGEGWVIQFLAPAGRGVGAPAVAGSFLSNYAPEARGGRGLASWTADPAKAMRFPSQAAAWECWTAVPRCKPVRADGKPNRPLTAYTVIITPAAEPADD